MDRSRRRSRAFTLVELLIVIGIIAVLMGILLPAMNKARASAQLVQCSSTMRQWGIAYQIYADANKGILPDDGEDGTASAPIGEWDGRPRTGAAARLGPLWIAVLPPLVSSKPYHELQAEATAGGTRLPFDGDNNMFVCPTSGQAVPARPSDPVQDGYFMMVGLTGGVKDPGTGRKTFFCYVPNSAIDRNMPANIPIKMAQLRPTSAVVLMTEKRMSPKEIPKANGPDGENYYDKFLARAKADWQRFSGRHRNGGNLLFADGHVSWFTNLEIAHPPGAKANSNYNQPGNVVWNPFRSVN